ncbi:hypothetical protein, conserved [Babesia bigemina]|uniref:Uncharacterized protein n=1 Tax=Babesia bigemina TaxID=5866 RepID=A0A061CZ74_BABBI|nr:hypothetical protein, conserved [Babesia bigemina]CDR93926.1 hypothetical protein, conserved [Babesia bigemina]|eukprot:XP_012766112.1 hypothetical protein, conserved [Babesia bigemina]
MEVNDTSSTEVIPLCHVVTVVSDVFLRFSNIERIERAVLQNAAELLARQVNMFTVYDSHSVLRRHFMRKYGGYTRCSVLTQPRRTVYDLDVSDCSSSVDGFEYNSETDSDSDSIYFLERSGSDFFLSTFHRVQHASRRGLRLCFLDRNHAHQQILSLSPSGYAPLDDWIDTPGVFLRSKQVRYRVPPEHHVSQLELQRQLNSIDGIQLPNADLVVTVYPGIRDSLLFLIAFFWLSLLQLLKCIFPRRFKPTMPPKLDLKLLLRCIAARISGAFCFGGSVIYSFGTDGIPPFFLADSELHQCFGLTVAAFSRCVDRYYTCQRRKGK